MLPPANEQCLTRMPQLMRVAGIPPSARELQSPEFPQGEAEGSALQAVRVWQGNVGGCPGEKIVVSGRVLSSFIEQPSPVPAPLTPQNISEATEQQSAAFPVKLRVERCKLPGWTIIDSDRSIVVDAGESITIDLLMPATWYDLATPTPEIAEIAIYQFANVYVRACPLYCCPQPLPRLTWFANLTDGDMVVRPRGARSLQISGPGIGGSQWTWYNGQTTGSGIPLGQFSLNGGFVNTDLRPGSASHLHLDSGAGAGGLFMFEWEIEG